MMAVPFTAKTLTATLVFMAFGVDAAVYCPANHCLKRAFAGNTSTSFTCEQYIDKGYQCAMENDPRKCTCDGFVKYGDYVRKDGGDKWSADKDVASKIECTNTAMGGDPISGSKFCWCKPRTPAATTRSTKPAKDSTAGGYATPKCIITDVLLAAMGMASPTLYGMGVNQGVANMIVAEGIHAAHSTTAAKWLAYDTSTLLSTVQIDCSTAAMCYGSAENALKKMLYERTSVNDQITSGAKAFIETYKAALGQLAALKDAVQVSVMPASFDDAPAPPSTETSSAETSHGLLVIFALALMTSAFAA